MEGSIDTSTLASAIAERDAARSIVRALVAAYPEWENDEQTAAMLAAKAFLAVADGGDEHGT